MEAFMQRLTTILLGLYIRAMRVCVEVLSGWQRRSQRFARRASEAGGFFSENFLYLAVFSIPVAFLFFLLARKFIWPYAQANIFPCFSGTGDQCFTNFGGNSFSDPNR